MKRGLIFCAILAPLCFTLPAAAQDHTGHQMPGMESTDSSSPATAAYKAAMDKMHAEMGAVQPSGDADVDFARGMIPHHQAAIDMAKAQLEHGDDPEIRKLSEDIISAQQREIKQLEDWLAAHAPE